MNRYKIVEVGDKKFTILLNGKVEGHTLSISNALQGIWVLEGSDVTKRFSEEKDNNTDNMYNVIEKNIKEKDETICRN